MIGRHIAIVQKRYPDVAQWMLEPTFSARAKPFKEAVVPERAEVARIPLSRVSDVRRALGREASVPAKPLTPAFTRGLRPRFRQPEDAGCPGALNGKEGLWPT